MGALILLASTSANAIPIGFGESESIEKIQDLDIPASETDGDSVFLAHLVSKHFFLAGIYVEDEGYVLGYEGDDSVYKPLDSSQITMLQAAGYLPDPMPEYHIRPIDYIIGYSLWIVLAIYALLRVFGKKQPEPESGNESTEGESEQARLTEDKQGTVESDPAQSTTADEERSR